MKHTLYAPFNDLVNVTNLIKLYKEGVSLIELSYHFNCPVNVINNTLLLHGIPKRKRVGNERVYIEPPVRKKDKYAYLLEEPINEGKNYSELLKEKGIKLPKTGSFEKIHNFDIRKIGLKKLDFVRKKKSLG